MSHHGTKAHGSKGRLYEPVAREDSSTPLKAEEQVAVEYCSDSESDGDAEAVPLASRQDRGKGPLRVSGAARPIQGPPPSALVHTNFLHQRRRLLILVALASALALGLLALLVRGPTFSTGADCPCRQPPDTPQYFRTDTGEWAGPTATGRAPFLAQTMAWDSPDRKNGNGQGDRTGGFVPNQPLQTAVPIEGMEDKESIFKMMGFLTPYQPSPGFGVDEHPLPPGAKIEQVHMLSRHGSRYPTTGSPPSIFGDKIAKMAGKFKAKGALSFLNDWSYGLGAEILVPKGRQELFESGVLHAYMYKQLYNTSTKLLVRTTTQDRMLKSAEYFLAGFFGLEWTNNAIIEVIIESDGFNNSLAGYDNCRNANGHLSKGETSVADTWMKKYLQGATERLNDLVDGFEWTMEDSYAAQQMCAYETVAYGYSAFCELFTYKEWVDFSYSIDLSFASNNGFQSPTGRAVGIGYQQEVIARLKRHTLGYSGSQINVTLDNNTVTFPLNQSLYFDFSHDTNIMSVLTAFGLRQFAALLPADKHPGPHNLTVSHIAPFAARLDMEIISTPHPLLPDRSGYDESGNHTKYIHFVLNQRTLPLGVSFPECDVTRIDGWCELGTFLKVQEGMPAKARYDYACNGDYEHRKYGEITDGAPL